MKLMPRPSVMIKYVPGTSVPAQFDLNVKVQYMDLLWMGASYRVNDGYAAMLGTNISNTVNIVILMTFLQPI
jgi:hypothetical protein